MEIKSVHDSTMQYGVVSRLNHWIGALFVLLLLGIGLYFDNMPRGSEKHFWLRMHVAIGTVAIFFLGFRVFWRMVSTSPLSISKHRPLQYASRLVHALLLIGITTLIMSGPLMIWSMGHPFGIFDFIFVSSPFPPFESWHDALEQAHEWAANIMLCLIIVHLLAVLKHQFIDRDGILARMTGRNTLKSRP